jgi:hypothetical protein
MSRRGRANIVDEIVWTLAFKIDKRLTRFSCCRIPQTRRFIIVILTQCDEALKEPVDIEWGPGGDA